MKEAKLIAEGIPAIPEYLELLANLREKYNIPLLGPDDDGITEILLADENIDWEEVHQEIKEKIINLDELFPEQLLGLMELGKNLTESNRQLSFTLC